MADKPSMVSMQNSEWYAQIEESVRELVCLLRNNGFNTVSSCGHANPCPQISMEWYGLEDDATKLYNLLCENGYNEFELHIVWPSSGCGRFMEVKLLSSL